MYIGILDDDISYSTILKEKLIKYGEHICKTYSHISNDILEEEFDIFFLDVMLDDKKSFDFGEELLSKNPNTILVYISSMEHFVYDSIYQRSFFFIRKSDLDNDLDRFFIKYNKRIIEENKKIDFVSNRCQYTLFLNDIYYIESSKNSVTIHTYNQEYTIYKSLTHIYNLLNQRRFYRLNSYIVINMKRVKTVNSNSFILDNSKEIRFTKGSRIPFINAYVIYRESRVWDE